MFRARHTDITVPYELIEQWQLQVLNHCGIQNADTETVKESLRVILLETGNLYQNVMRLENGLKPVKDKKKNDKRLYRAF